MSLPAFLYFIVGSTIVACTLGSTVMILGFALQGYVWVLALVFSAYIVATKIKKVSFPILLWLPWVVLLIAYLIYSDFENALQRTIMILCPLVVGMAASAIDVRDAGAAWFGTLITNATKVFFVFVLLHTGLLFTGTLPKATGLAPQVMTGALLATVFAARYVFTGSKQLLYYWAGLAAVPVIALTRMGIVAVMLTLPLTLAPLKSVKRLLLLAVLLAVGIGVFYSERVQQKMFYSGAGELTDIDLSNPDFATTGRRLMWEVMEEEMKLSPILGFGANANETYMLSRLQLRGHPHNDWIRVRFDYGYLGAGVFALCMLLQVWHALKRARKTTGMTRVFFYAGASSFIPFCMFMYTDNIILYCQFFGNLQLTILGLAYASLRTADEDARRQQLERRRQAFLRQQQMQRL